MSTGNPQHKESPEDLRELVRLTRNALTAAARESADRQNAAGQPAATESIADPAARMLRQAPADGGGK